MNKLIPQDLIPLGKVIKPHGIKGELKLLLYNKNSNILSKMLNIWIRHDETFDYYNLEFVKGIKDIIVKFSQVDDRDVASLLSGREFFVSRSEFPDIDKENFYLVDIIKFKVFDGTEEIGFISDVLFLPGGNILEINYKGNMILVPMVDKYIEFFDFDEKKITVNGIQEFKKL